MLHWVSDFYLTKRNSNKKTTYFLWILYDFTWFIHFFRSVVVAPCLRGQGIGTQLMQRAETHCKDSLGIQTVYLSTYDKQSFYSKLGYQVCEPISIFGTRNFGVNIATKKTYMKKNLIWVNTKVVIDLFIFLNVSCFT